MCRQRFEVLIRRVFPFNREGKDLSPQKKENLQIAGSLFAY